MSRPYTSVYFSPDRGAIDVLVGFIDRAMHTLDVAVYSITHQRVADALVNAHLRGVRVRILTDKTQAGGLYSKDEYMEAAGIPVRRDIKAGAMHAKYAVCDVGVPDAYAVLAGSYNWTQNAEERNVEHLSINRLKYVTEAYSKHYEEIWALNDPALD